MGQSTEMLGLANDQLRRGVDVCGALDPNIQRCEDLNDDTGLKCDLSSGHGLFWPDMPHEKHGMTMATRDVLHSWPVKTAQQRYDDEVRAIRAAAVQAGLADVRSQDLQAGAEETQDAPVATRRLLGQGRDQEAARQALLGEIPAQASEVIPSRYIARALQGLNRVLILVEDMQAPGDSHYPLAFKLEDCQELWNFPTASAQHRLIERGWMPIRQVGDGTWNGWVQHYVTIRDEPRLVELVMPVHPANTPTQDTP